MTATTPDLWHHSRRPRAATDRAVPTEFHWNWNQDNEPHLVALARAGARCDRGQLAKRPEAVAA